MKKVIFILLGISFVLGGVIFVLYKNNYSKNDDVVDIFKEKDNSDNNDNSDEKEKIEDLKDDTNTVIVDIKGMVVNPGVYEVPSSFRVNDVIETAGGLLDGADTSKINLAKIVSDEMTIIIYSNEEIIEKYKNEVCVCDCPDISNDACISDNNEDDTLVNINTADIDELMEIKGIGRSKAKAIIEYRDKMGNFNSIDDIKNVDGIGDSLFEKIKMYIKV